MCANQTFSAPIGDRLYRNVASPGDLRDRKHSAFTKAVEAALQSISLSNVADRYRCQRQAVACLETFFIEDSSRIGIVVVFEKAVHFGYHLGILFVTLAMTQQPCQYQCLFHSSA